MFSQRNKFQFDCPPVSEATSSHWILSLLDDKKLFATCLVANAAGGFVFQFKYQERVLLHQAAF